MTGLGLLLADTSVWARSATGPVAERFQEAIERGRVAITPVVRLEVLFMAQGTAAYDRLRMSLDALHQVPLDATVAARAEEASGTTLWHYDEDYDRIAAVTGQSAEWIVARGSVP